MKKTLHKMIEDDIQKKIRENVYMVGETIPTEVELAKQYKVSRPTVRQAIHTLVNQGLLERKQKIGTIVKKSKFSQDMTHVIESFDDEMMKKGLKTSSKVLLFKTVKATEEIANNLQIKEGDLVHKLVRLRYIDQNPIFLITSYIPYNKTPNLSDYNFAYSGLYKTLEQLGYPVNRSKRKMEVMNAGETESDLLEINVNDAIFYIHINGYSNNIPIEYSISKYRGDLNYFVFEITNS